MEIGKILQNLSGPKTVTVAMWAVLLVLAIIVGLALLNCGTA
jgi:energy-converting hydrogenase Eha subunit F